MLQNLDHQKIIKMKPFDIKQFLLYKQQKKLVEYMDVDMDKKKQHRYTN